MDFKELRKLYHQELCEKLIHIRKEANKPDFPNNADGSSKIRLSKFRMGCFMAKFYSQSNFIHSN